MALRVALASGVAGMTVIEIVHRLATAPIRRGTRESQARRQY
jgi:hypothetical protein